MTPKEWRAKAQPKDWKSMVEAGDQWTMAKPERQGTQVEPEGRRTTVETRDCRAMEAKAVSLQMTKNTADQEAVVVLMELVH